MSEPQQPSVYISATANDDKWLRRISTHLKNAGFRVLDSTDVGMNQIVDVDLTKFRELSEVFVILVSEQYLDSSAGRNSEFSHISSLVREAGRRAICVILEECEWRRALFPDSNTVVIPADGHTFWQRHADKIQEDLHTLAREVRRAIRETSQREVRLSGANPEPKYRPETDTLKVNFSQEQEIPESEPSMTREMLKRFSLDALEALSRAERIRKERKAGRVHTVHLIGAFREQVDHGDSEAGLRRFLKANEKNLEEALNYSYGPHKADRMEVPMLGEPPKVSLNARRALLTAIEKAGTTGRIEEAHVLFGLLSTTTNERVRKLNERGMTPDKVPFTPAAAAAAKTAEAEKPRAKEEPDESIALGSICDIPAETDALGFKPYVDAIASFLRSEETKPPLTLSIEGEWGSGKSSFMLQVKNAVTEEPLFQRLREAWKEPENVSTGGAGKKKTRQARLWDAVWQKRFSVQFNPWRHDKEDSLWAAFALEFLRQVSRQRFFLRRWWGTLRLFAAHYSWRKGWFEALRAVVVWFVILLLVVALPVAVFVYKPHWAQQAAIALNEKLSQPSAAQTSFTRPVAPASAEGAKKSEPGEKKPEEPKKDNFDVILKVLLLAGGNAAYFAVVLTIWLKAKDVVGNPLEIDLKKYLKSPDYEGRVAFVEQFHEDFRKIVDSYAGEGRVYVFVDDLDRCEVPKAAELIKAVNLLIAEDPRLIFILGMDREKVAAGLAVKYEKLLPYLLANAPAPGDEVGWKRRGGLEFGQTFLQKFIQLPFRVPGPNLETYGEFIGTFSGAAPTRLRDEPTDSESETLNGVFLGETKVEPPPEPAPVGESIRPAMPRTKPPTVEEAEIRRQRELQFRGDSPKFQEAALMFAATLGTNPRRLIQFINLLRLQAYIVNGIGFFDRGIEGGNPITVGQLGKFVAIGLRWPALLAEFAARPDFLGELEDYANGTKKAADEMGPSKPTAPPAVQIWLDQPGMTKFLKYGMEKDRENYTLKNATLYRLLSICPRRVRAPNPPASATVSAV